MMPTTAFGIIGKVLAAAVLKTVLGWWQRA
jgi:hypothetical protein